MSILLLLLTFVLCLVVEASLDYDEAGDARHDALLHRIERWIHNLLCDDEKPFQD